MIKVQERLARAQKRLAGAQTSAVEAQEGYRTLKKVLQKLNKFRESSRTLVEAQER